MVAHDECIDCTPLSTIENIFRTCRVINHFYSALYFFKARTFSVIARDPIAQELGIAVATNNIYVGNSTVYVQPGLAAFSVIAETNPNYAINGFSELNKDKFIKEAN